MKHFIILFLAFYSFACAENPKTAEPQSEKPAAEAPDEKAEDPKAEAPTEAKSADKEPAPAPEAKKEIASIVTLGGNVTETVFALGHGEKIVGVDMSSVFPEEATKKKQVGYYRRVSAEGIISLSPGLVIASSASGPAEVLKKVTDVGIKIETVPDTKTVEGAKERISLIAKILGEEEKGKALIEKIDGELKKVSAATPAKKVLFIYARGAGSLSVAGTKTAADAMIKLAGGVNAVEGYEGYKPMNSESIVAAAPDVILLTTRGLESIGGIEAVRQLKGIDLTPAAKNKAIVALDDLMLLGFGPRTGEAVATLAEKLNPEPSPAQKP